MGSRISQLIGFAKQAGVHIDNLKTLYAEGGGFKGLFKKIIGTKEFRAGRGELAAYGAGVVAEGLRWPNRGTRLRGGRYVREGNGPTGRPVVQTRGVGRY